MLTFYYTLSILLMILTPVALAALFRRRYPVPWLLFLIGTLTFIGSQVVHLPLNDLLTSLGILPKPGVKEAGISLVQTCLVLGFTAGLCEETARAVGYFFLKRYRGLEHGVMLGLGHGGVESMVFGGVLTAATVSSLIPIVGTDLSTLNLSPEQLSNLTMQLDALQASPLFAAVGPYFERLLAMTVHLILSMMVLQAFRRRNVLFYIIAIAYHLLIDAAVVYAATLYSSLAITYPVLIALIIPGLVWLVFLWRKESRPASVYDQPAGVELGIFLAAMRKEIIQQWRTRRFLVVLAVFVLFGLTSPLVAKYTPEVIKSFPGAEKIASLIPIPTVADAMAQYVKNITQFGFILAVLLGMNAIAAEKESGTAAMILSKPLPRWAFVLSKFAAQSLVYLSAFVVSGLGAYYYSLILFGPLDPARFTAINLLLLLWLLAFVGAALLGSVIGSSIAAAAGFGLGISVVILLAGNIPMYGSLFPSGLMAWASMLGASADKVPVNGGAIAGAVTLIVLCLLWSVALFERQEI